MLQNNSELAVKIRQLWDKFWAGGIANPLTAIEQITYLLFMKRLDELDLKKQSDAAFTGEPYTSWFEGIWLPPKFRNLTEKDQKKHFINRKELRWSEFTHKQADAMLEFVRDSVFPFMQELNGETSQFTKHMANAVFIIPKASLLVEATSTINEIFEIMEKDAQEGGQTFQDIQGDVYEYLLSEIATAGKNGQFRTPRHIIKLMAELVLPQLGQKILDPACGTAGFLLGAYQYIVTQLAINAGKKDITPDEDGFVRTSVAVGLTEKAQAILNDTLFGFDFDVTMVRLSLMNLMMHGIDNPKVDYQDTLSKSFAQEADYDVILANPPFTGSIDKGDINPEFTLGTTKTELLFVENIYRLLKNGGTGCVIVPQGVLFGSAKAFKALRQILVDCCDLKAVIAMPSGVFKPYAGVSTAILLFTRVYGPQDKVTKPATRHVWFYDMTSDGYTLDDKRQKHSDHGDLQDIVTRYHARSAKVDTDRKEKYFMVPRDKIVTEGYDLTFSRYKEDTHEQVHYDQPLAILERLIQAEVGEVAEENLEKVQSGIVRELLTLRGILSHED